MVPLSYGVEGAVVNACEWLFFSMVPTGITVVGFAVVCFGVWLAGYKSIKT